MTDRVLDLIVGLQRMADNVVTRGEDLRYMQHQEMYDYIGWLDQQLDAVEKVRASLLAQRQKFMPTERAALPKQDADPKLPRVVAQGPKAAQG